MTSHPISLDDFFRAQEQEEYPLYPEQLHPLKKALEDDKTDVSILAEQIARPILEANKKRNADPGASTGFSYTRLWRVIASAIEQLTPYIDRIVELVVELSKVPDDTGYMAFMQDMNEYWNEFAMGIGAPRWNDPKRWAVRQGWININAFNAKLSTYNIQRLNQRLRSAHVFRIALEETPWERYHHPEIEERIAENPEDEATIAWRDEQLEQFDVRILNYWAAAAAVWIKYDGKGVYEMNGKAMIGDDYANYQPTNWTASKGFSKERFDFWRQRFEWVSQVTALEHDTRKRAAEAAKFMIEIQKGGQSSNN